MGESNDSVNGILLGNIDKEITNKLQPSYDTCKIHPLYW